MRDCYQSIRFALISTFVAALAATLSSPSVAQENETTGASRSGLITPANYFSLPIEIEHDFGADNGEATLARLMPLYSLKLNDDWRLVNLDIITLADAPGGVPGRPINPSPESTADAFGVGDLIHASFFTPEDQGDFIWGAGLILSLPTATDKALGSGKWAAGPALRITKRTAKWDLGGVMGQRWSFAGDADRQDISSLMVRGTVRRKLEDRWYLISAPIISANWRAPASQQWLIPLGGGIGRTFRVGPKNWAGSIQAYYNVVKPDAAPNWAVRFQVVAPIPRAPRPR